MTENQIIARVCGGIFIFLIVMFGIGGIAKDEKAPDQEKDTRKSLEAGIIVGFIFECLYVAVVLWK